MKTVVNLEKAKKLYRQLFKDVPKVKTSYKTKIERHGSVYGGWNILPKSLTYDSVVYSVGIGQDISFDLSLIKHYACKVYGYDPTPGVYEWLVKQVPDKNFLFFQEALSDKNGTLKFYKPKKETNISHTTAQEDHTLEDYVEVPCKTIIQMMKDNQHTSIDLLKMDIEGEELKVIDFILEQDLKIEQLLIEFHHFLNPLLQRLLKNTSKN